MIAIHIGTSKAGSTTIQRFFSENADALRRNGVNYPRVGIGTRGSHVNLYYDLRGHRNFNPKYGSISQLIENLKYSKSRTAIISAEEFQRCTPSEVALLKSQLSSVDSDICIRLIIRDLVDLMPSTYSQSTKVSENILDFDTFFLARVGACGKAFLATARVWGNAFGWEQLRVRVLDRRQLLNGDLIDDFLAGIGVEPNACGLRRPEEINLANASPGWRVLEAVRAIFSGAHGLPAGHPLGQSVARGYDERKLIGRIARQLGNELGWNADRGRYLSGAQARKCIEVHSKAIASLNEHLPHGLPQPVDLAARGFVEREWMPEASRIPAQELRGFYEELAARAAPRLAPVTSI